MQGAATVEEAWTEVERLARVVVAFGAEAGLPFVAAQCDLGDPEPMADAEARAYAERLRWVEGGTGYWRARRHARRRGRLGAGRLASCMPARALIWAGAIS